MILNVLESLDVLDLAMAFVAATHGNVKRAKRLLERAEDEACNEESKKLLSMMRMKITQMEDQWEGESGVV